MLFTILTLTIHSRPVVYIYIPVVSPVVVWKQVAMSAAVLECFTRVQRARYQQHYTYKHTSAT